MEVLLTEVGPRDGLQNEKEILTTEQKLLFIQKLVEAGFKQIEVGSFVSPKWVPQMADSAEIFSKLEFKAGVRYIALVPNEKGLERALDLKVESIALFTAVSESFNRKNINMSVEESFQQIEKIIAKARAEKIWIRGYLSTCFGCPYEGKIDPQRVIDLTHRFLDLGIDELSLGDTIGVATPNQVSELMKSFEKSSLSKIALHFHDTRGTALANVLEGLKNGVTHFDSSAGGLGGCPYAPGAAGNLATEDLLYMLNGMGEQTGVDLSKVVEASQVIQDALSRKLPSRYFQAVSPN